MHNETNTEYYDVQGVLFYDPVLTYGAVQDSIPAVPFVDYWAPLFSLNDTFMDSLHERADSCGFTEFMETAMTFPPKGPLPDPPSAHAHGCHLWKDIIPAAQAVNPCWDVYQVATVRFSVGYCIPFEIDTDDTQY